jgi:hypothetical protein
MLLDEEAQSLENRILRHARKIEDVPKLKEILQDALPDFEESLKTLSKEDREAALSLYLDKIRRVTFGFHLAMLQQTARSEFRVDPTHHASRAILNRFDEDMRRVASLYCFV